MTRCHAVTQAAEGHSPNSCTTLPPAVSPKSNTSLQPWIERRACFHLQSVCAGLCNHTHTHSSAHGFMTTPPLESFLLTGHSLGPAPVGMLAVQTAQGSAQEGNMNTNSVISSHAACPACPWPSWPARDNMPCPWGCHWHQDLSFLVHPSLTLFLLHMNFQHMWGMNVPWATSPDSLLPYSDGGNHLGFGTLPCNKPSASNKTHCPPRRTKHLSLIFFIFFLPSLFPLTS